MMFRRLLFMENQYQIVSECLQYLETSGMHPLRKMKLEMYFYKIKRLLLDDGRLSHYINYHNSDEDFSLLLEKTRDAHNQPECRTAFSSLENHVTKILIALQPVEDA